jgi:hypothetical protein
MDMKFGSSAGAGVARRELLDMCRHSEHLDNREARSFRNGVAPR